MLRDERELNRKLLAKLGIIERREKEFDNSELTPIRKFTPLRTKIKEAEEADRLEYNKLLEKLQATGDDNAGQVQ